MYLLQLDWLVLIGLLIHCFISVGITELLKMVLQLWNQPLWISFLLEAGIPETELKTYAKLFVENRITEQTVLSLTSENLETLGVTVLGDKLTILTHQIHLACDSK